MLGIPQATEGAVHNRNLLNICRKHIASNAAEKVGETRHETLEKNFKAYFLVFCKTMATPINQTAS